MGRTKLTPKDAMKQHHYQNIIELILSVNSMGRKITFAHLKYALVKNATSKMTKKQIQNLDKVFKYPKPVKATLLNGRTVKWNTLLDAMTTQEIITESKKFKRSSNLWNFKDNLIKLGLIEEKKKGKKQYLYLTTKGFIYVVNRTYTVTSIESFINTIINSTDFNNIQDVKECRSILNSLHDDIFKSIRRIVLEYKLDYPV